MTIRRYHVFGQRCSGTNALIRFVEQNFPDLNFCEKAGFKHWAVPFDRTVASDTLVIVIARDILSWLQSLYRKPWHAHPDLKAMNFSDFIRSEWRSVRDEDFWGIEPGDGQYGKPIREEQCPLTGLPFENSIIPLTHVC